MSVDGDDEPVVERGVVPDGDAGSGGAASVSGRAFRVAGPGAESRDATFYDVAGEAGVICPTGAVVVMVPMNWRGVQQERRQQDCREKRDWSRCLLFRVVPSVAGHRSAPLGALCEVGQCSGL